MEGYGLAVFPHGLEMHRDGRHRGRGPLGAVSILPPIARSGERGEIQGFSKASRKRLAFRLANGNAQFAVHITLTYHARVDETDDFAVSGRNWQLVHRSKHDLNRFLSCLRSELGRYVWIQEFQKRGAIHFHVLAEHAVRVERATTVWCRATGQLQDVHALKHSVKVQAVEDQTLARRYLVAYFGKAEQKQMPVGIARAGRFWAASQDLVMVPVDAVVTSPPKGPSHDPAAMQVVRGVRRFVSKVVGFKWTGGRIVDWEGTLSARAASVMAALSKFYGLSGSVPQLTAAPGSGSVECAEVDDGIQLRRELELGQSPVGAAGSGSGAGEAAGGGEGEDGLQRAS